ncbi:unnamed protein product [Ectocarpus sp. 12 AP-2014]
MSEDARLAMEANLLLLISRKIAKANFVLRKMRSRWDIFRERHRRLALLVQDRRRVHRRRHLPCLCAIPLLGGLCRHSRHRHVG